MRDEAPCTPVSLLLPGEPPAYEVVDGDEHGGVVLVCDHASNRVPRRLGTLGVDAAALASHIGWDPGAAEVARRLADMLEAPLVLSGYTRLAIDCNRPPSSTESIPEHSGGVAVPGNAALSAADHATRMDGLFKPYHAAVADLLDRRGEAGEPSFLLSLHSFTPVLNGHRRPWQVGVTYRQENRFALLLRRELDTSGDLVVGHNQPYEIETDSDYTIPVHGEGRGLPHALLEIRQDGLATPSECAQWAERLARACRRVVAAMQSEGGLRLSRREW